MNEQPDPVAFGIDPASPAADPASTTRRQFLLLTAATVAVCGCQSVGTPGGTAAGGGHPRNIDAGPVSGYAHDGVYPNFRDLGFFVIRSGGKLTALSSICTHRNCKLTAEADRTYYCECHGSTFDPTGKVTEGPATRNLPVLPTSNDAGGHLIVTVSG
jgi:Rieske Fe-S protein